MRNGSSTVRLVDNGAAVTLNIGATANAALSRSTGGLVHFVETGENASITFNTSSTFAKDVAIGWATYGTGGEATRFATVNSAGSAIAHALSTAGAESIDIVDPLAGRAESLRARLADARPGTAFRTARSIRKDADMIVNASPVGMQDGDALPADIGPLSSETIVGDVVIRSEPKTLVRHAIACGCEWVDGRAMLAGQADAIMAFFAPGLRATASRTPDDAKTIRDGAHTR